MDNRKFVSKIGLRYFIASVLIFVAQNGVALLVNEINPDLYVKFGFLIVMLTMYLVAGPIIFWMLSRIPVEVNYEKQKLGIGKLLMFFVMAYAGMYISNIIGVMITNAIGILKHSPVNNAIVDVALNNSIWLNLFIMVFCAPIFEELLFRKYFIDRMGRFGDKYAIFMSGLAFGLFHGNINQFFYAFVIGMLFGYVYVRTGNVKYTIILHMMVNFMGSVATTFLIRDAGLRELVNMQNVEPEQMMQFLAEHMAGLLAIVLFVFLILAIVILGIVFFCVNIKKITFRPAIAPIEKGKYFSTTVLNVGMGLFFIFWIGMMIYATII